MKRFGKRFLSVCLCLSLLLSAMFMGALPKAEAGSGMAVLQVGAKLLMFGVKTTLTVGSMIAKNNGNPETAAMLSKWTFPGGTTLVPMIQELGKQMAQMHQEVMQELQFIEDKLDRNLSGIQTALGNAAANDAYDNLLEAWNSDVTAPMEQEGYHHVVNAYKNYLEYAGSYKTGSTVTFGGQETVATEQMVKDCRDTFYSAWISMSGVSYDANCGMSMEAYYDHILYETNTVDMKVQNTVNNLLDRMLNTSGAPVGGRYIDRAAQAAFAYFSFSEDQAAFVDAAVQKQAHEINMALMAYQEFIGMRLEYCTEKVNAAKEGGASEAELAELQSRIDQYCAPNTSVLNLIYGGAPCTHPGGVIAAMETWLSEPVYISNADKSYLYLENYLRATDTQKYTLTNQNFIAQTDPDALIAESMNAVISQSIFAMFEGPLSLDIQELVSQAERVGEQTQFLRRGVVVPNKNGQATVKPIYMLVDETEDRTDMFMTNLNRAYRPAHYPSDFAVPNADFYNLRDGVFTDGLNTYTLTTGSRLKALTNYNPLSLGGGQLQNYFRSVIGTYPEGREMYVLTAQTTADTDAYGHKHSGINMTTVATFSEEFVPYTQQASTSYMVVLDSTDSDTYVKLTAKAAGDAVISVTGDHYDPATGKAKAGTAVTVTVAFSGSSESVIKASYFEDTVNPSRVTYTQELLSREMTASMVSADNTLTLQFAVPYANVELEVEEAVCSHPEDRLSKTMTNSFGKHTVTTVCACGEYRTTVTEDCKDADGNDFCDTCGGSLLCSHSQAVPYISPHGDGTHTLGWNCGNCGQSGSQTESCYDKNGDKKCDLCYESYTGAVAQVGDVQYATVQEAVNNAAGAYVKLLADSGEHVTAQGDLYLDLNGFDLAKLTLSGTLYGVDSATDDYDCSDGYGTIAVLEGNPAAQHKRDISGTVQRYVAIRENTGVSFHRIYLALTHMSLKTDSVGVGYKAVFYADSVVIANLDSFGYTMTLENNTPKTVTAPAGEFVSGKSVSLRISNYDVENYGETPLSAFVMLRMADGTQIESTECTMTMRGFLETLNRQHTQLNANQKLAVAELIQKHEIMQTWDVANILKSPESETP